MRDWRQYLPLAIFVAALWVYSWFSYALTAPNLILTSWGPYWQFQTWMWENFFNNRLVLTRVFAGISITVWLSFLASLASQSFFKFFSSTAPIKRISIIALTIILPLMLANNALSYDVFNYIFNAKMIVVYQANPHQEVALTFADRDDWVRFMHNIHTPAPYGYGWTTLSLIPYLVGFGSFLLTWEAFRFFSMLSWFGLLLYYWSSYRHHSAHLSWFWVIAVIFNPLLMIEVIANSHNDLWMMLPAVVSLAMLGLSKKSRPILKKIIISGLLLAVSISIKLATVLLIPVWVILVTTRIENLPFHKKLKSWLEMIAANWALIASMIMLLPLLTSRSQQFHPWYWTWPAVWLPFMQGSFLHRWWKYSIFALGVSSFFRYLPFLLSGNFTTAVISQQKMITWLPAILVSVLSLCYLVFLEKDNVKKN